MTAVHVALGHLVRYQSNMPAVATSTMDFIEKTLFGYAAERFGSVAPGGRFVHYTTIESAIRILDGSPLGMRSLWLRNARLMNDLSEIKHGQQCLSAALDDPGLALRLRNLLDAIAPGLHADLMRWLDRETQSLIEDTYVLSLALHEGHQAVDGVLSMWARYGGPDNVCLVFSPTVITPRNDMGLVLSPVMYGGPDAFLHHFGEFCGRLESALPRLRRIDRRLLLHNLKRAIAFAVCSTKHQSFDEEKEWRVLFAPEANRNLLPEQRVRIRGVDQTVFKIPLSYVGDMATLIERIVINPIADYKAASALLAPSLGRAGIPNPSARVLKSAIPIRP
jgi:hypothetical protein